MKTRSWLAGILAGIAVTLSAARAEVKVWTGGAGSGRWNDPANWAPAGVPGWGDDAVVPGDSGDILLPCVTGDPAKVIVRSLVLQDSAGGPALTVLLPDPPCKGIEIEARSKVRIGQGCLVRGRNGTFRGEPGGDIVIRVTGTAARIEIGGKVIGGDGGPAEGGVPPGKGGGVRIGEGNNADRIVIEYDGEVTGGMGGRNPEGKGGTGGDVKIDGKTIDEGGRVRGGAGGPGRTPEEKGEPGTVAMHAVEGLFFPPGPPRPDALSGNNIVIDIENGRVLVHDLRAHGWVAKVSISISVTFGPPGTPGDIEFHNCDPDFMHAGVDICLFGRPLLDPGLTLGDLCDPDPATPAAPCPRPFHATDFESPGFEGSIQGTPLAGQEGFAVPPGPLYHRPGHLENFNDFLNDPSNPVLPPQAPPALGRQFIAAVNPGGAGLAGIEHAKTFTRERWRVEFAAAANFIGSSRPSSKIGSVSLEPMPGSAAFAIQGRWMDANTPNRWGVELVHFDAAGQGPITTPVPHPAFQNLPGATWFGFGAEVDLRTGRIERLTISDAAGTSVHPWECPPVCYLGGGANGAPLPTALRFGTGGGQAWGNVWAIDNVRVEPIRDSCYPDCDRSNGNGLLDIFDFLCFQNRFAQNDPYACDCDTQSGAGVCDIFDFLCFQNAFGAGCP